MDESHTTPTFEKSFRQQLNIQHRTKRRRLSEAEEEYSVEGLENHDLMESSVDQKDEPQDDTKEHLEELSLTFNVDYEKEKKEFDLIVSQTHVNPINKAAHESMERIAAAALHCKGMTELNTRGLQTVAYAVMNFLRQLATESKKQAEISQRSKANVFDMTRALVNVHPSLASRLFSSTSKTLVVSEKQQELIRQVHRNLPLVRPYSLSSLDCTYSTDLSKSEIPSIDTAEYWRDLGEQEIIESNSCSSESDQRWQRQRFRWKFIDTSSTFPFPENSNEINKSRHEEDTKCDPDINPTSTSSHQIQPYLPVLPPTSFRLGYDKRICIDGSDLIEPPPDPEERQNHILEDHLYVQLLLPKVLQKVPEIQEVQFSCEKEAKPTEITAEQHPNLFVIDKSLKSITSSSQLDEELSNTRF